MASIREVPAKTRRFERIGSHTHVKGLGLDKKPLIRIVDKEEIGKKRKPERK